VATREQDLIRQVQEGKPGSFAQLVDQYRTPLHHSISKIVGDADAASDITQQAFVTAYENIDKFDPEYRFFSWVFRIAHNQAMNRLRRRRLLCPLGDQDLACTCPAPDALIEQSECCRDVNAALATLRHKYRVVLVLRHYLDLSYEEIARFTGVPTSTVRSRIHTARGLMRDRLLRQGVGASG